MSEHHREQPLGIISAQRKSIGVTHARVRDTDKHFAFTRRGHINFKNLKGLPSGKRNSGAGFHGCFSGIESIQLALPVSYSRIDERSRTTQRVNGRRHDGALRSQPRLQGKPISSSYGSMTINHWTT
jgi:hypothetical protein